MPSAFATLQKFARREPPRERCELCGVGLAPTHRHLLEMASRQVACACDPCALRFQDVVAGRFMLIPRDPRALPDFQMSEAQWEELALPISLAFFLRHTDSEKVTALYPSPAGATESLLPLTAWSALVEQNPVLRTLAPAVEALLVNRTGATRAYYLTPLDACYELVGLVRLHWRGFSGGDEVWREIEQFFTRLAGRAIPVEALHA